MDEHSNGGGGGRSAGRADYTRHPGGLFRCDIPGPCPHCGAQTDSATVLYGDGHGPEAGDLSLCIGCNRFSLFTGIGLLKRKPTAAEAADIASYEIARVAQRVMRGRTQ